MVIIFNVPTQITHTHKSRLTNRFIAANCCNIPFFDNKKSEKGVCTFSFSLSTSWLRENFAKTTVVESKVGSSKSLLISRFFCYF